MPTPRVSRAEQIARLLADRGPMQTWRIADAIGANPSAVSQILRLHAQIFWKPPGDKRQPWAVTDVGRRLYGLAPLDPPAHTGE